jgi:hypothetical protein
VRIAYSNLIDDLASTAFTASGAATGFPVTNVQEQRLSVRWRTESPTAQSVIIDLGSAASVTVAAVGGHNLSASATTTIAGGTSSSVFTTAVSITRNADLMLSFFASKTFQYWKFSITDPTNTDGYIEVGRLWIGTYITVSPSSLLDFTVTKKRSDMVTIGKNRQKYASPGEGWRRFELSFPATGSTTLTAIQTMYNTVGNHTSMIFCNFDSLTTHDLVYPCYVSIDGDIAFKHDKRQKYTYALTLEENK